MMKLYSSIPRDSASKVKYILQEQNFYQYDYKDTKEHLDQFFGVKIFGGLDNSLTTLDPQYTVLAKKYKNYIFDDLLFNVDKFALYKSMIPIVANAGVVQSQTPIPVSAAECNRISYYFGTESPGQIANTSSAVKSRCLNSKTRFKYLVKFYPTYFYENDPRRNFNELINLNKPRTNQLFQKKLFIAPDPLLRPDKTHNVYYEIRFRVRRYIRIRFCNLHPNKLPIWPDEPYNCFIIYEHEQITYAVVSRTTKTCYDFPFAGGFGGLDPRPTESILQYLIIRETYLYCR